MRMFGIALAVALVMLTQTSKAAELDLTAKPLNYSPAIQSKQKPSLLSRLDIRKLVGEGACGSQGCGPCERPFYDDLGRFGCYPCRSCRGPNNKCSGNC